MSLSRNQLVEFLKEVDITGKKVLDLGVGSKPAKDFVKGDSKLYVTMDVDAQFNPDIIGDLNLKPHIWNYKAKGESVEIQRYEVIFCLETLEHLWNPLEAVRTVYKLLEEEGVAYFSTPFLNPYHDQIDYARYTDEWYSRVLVEVGFKDIEIKPRVATDGLPYLMQFYKTEGLRMSKIRAGQEHKNAWIGFFVKAVK